MEGGKGMSTATSLGAEASLKATEAATAASAGIEEGVGGGSTADGGGIAGGSGGGGCGAIWTAGPRGTADRVAEAVWSVGGWRNTCGGSLASLVLGARAKGGGGGGARSGAGETMTNGGCVTSFEGKCWRVSDRHSRVGNAVLAAACSCRVAQTRDAFPC